MSMKVNVRRSKDVGNVPGGTNVTEGASVGTRKIVFISKATPEDDEFVLWLAPEAGRC